MECVPCGKTFTGSVCYEQRIMSEKHKKKVLSYDALHGQNSSSQIGINISNLNHQNNIRCEVCGISFNCFENFQKHSFSQEHARRIMVLNVNDRLNGDVTSSTDLLANEDMHAAGDGNKSDGKNNAILHETEVNKIFPSPSFTTVQSFYCEPCKKICSGPIPYVQHMESEVHKKKVQHLKFLELYASQSQVDSSPRMNVSKTEENNYIQASNPWFCDICNVQCSGIFPYQQHLAGAAHIKNKTKQQYSALSSNSMQATVQQQSNGPNTANASLVMNSNRQQLNKVDMEVDSLVPRLTKLNVMSHDELKKSIEVFLPNEKVDFDKAENEMNIDSADENVEKPKNDTGTDSANENVEKPKNYTDTDSANENGTSHVSEEIEQKDEVTVKPGVFQVCQFCNVELFNAEDVASHYESPEHFNKRWHSN